MDNSIRRNVQNIQNRQDIEHQQQAVGAASNQFNNYGKQKSNNKIGVMAESMQTFNLYPSNAAVAINHADQIDNQRIFRNTSAMINTVAGQGSAVKQGPRGL